MMMMMENKRGDDCIRDDITRIITPQKYTSSRSVIGIVSDDG
jgi:hypothetical protein